MDNQIEIYKSPEGIQIEIKFDGETVWATQKQIAEIFQTTPQNITLHLKKLYKLGEIEQILTCKEYLQVQKEGKREVQRKQIIYNLDAILSVGYRVNSKRGTQFRQWATQRLKDYLVQGYSLNEKRLEKKNQQVKYLKTGIRIISRAFNSPESKRENLKIFAKALELLDDYDNERLDSKGKTKLKAKYPNLEDYKQIISSMKNNFSSLIFAQSKDNSFESAINQIRQTYSGKDLYPTIEEKAATLIYLIVKNHCFIDGNKRIGAACFLYFLDRNKLLYNSEKETIISNDALAALTLFVASSKPSEMETVKNLIISILNRKNTL